MWDCTRQWSLNQGWNTQSPWPFEVYILISGGGVQIMNKQRVWVNMPKKKNRMLGWRTLFQECGAWSLAGWGIWGPCWRYLEEQWSPSCSQYPLSWLWQAPFVGNTVDRRYSGPWPQPAVSRVCGLPATLVCLWGAEAGPGDKLCEKETPSYASIFSLFTLSPLWWHMKNSYI